MPDVAGFPYAEVQFTKRGRVHDGAEADAAVAALRDAGATDVLVVSHGWNTDMAAARDLYARLLAALRAELPNHPALAGRSFGVVAVLWPSLRFAPEGLIPGGGAAALGAHLGAVRMQLDELIADAADEPAVAADLRAAAGLLDDLEDSPRRRHEFVARVRSAMPAGEPDDESALAAIDAVLADPRRGGDEILERLKVAPVFRPESPTLGGAAGFDGGTGRALGGAFGGLGNAVRGFLNVFTYYRMKERAGRVGERGLAPLLDRFAAELPGARRHLAGHSFGARLVTAAAVAHGDDLGAVTLLQAAFSHYAFAERWDGDRDGLFRPLLTGGRLRGPLAITHTRNDLPVGLAYAIASRIANQIAAAIGDADDPYGGLGSNGAQRTPEAEFAALLPVGDAYPPDAPVLNLLADDVIGGHSDIVHPEVAHAILSGIERT